MADESSKPIGRRMFLGLSAIGAGTLLFGQSFVGGDGEAGLVSELIGQGGFRIYTVAPIPKFDPGSWKLAITGKVAQPIQLGYDELLALPSKVQQGVFHCVTGWSVSNLTWQGVSLQTILDLAGPHQDAQGLIFSSADGAYTDSLTLDQALAPGVMLAYNMNAKPLPLNQGLPVRLIVPEMYGYKSVKWVNKIELVPKAGPGYWEVRGYDIDAYIDKRNRPQV
ncbi:MAG TPA: molybdopterin-dependent oxidoreductase [Chloroflexota bacterium]